ncbi:MAG TPA: PorP/SprF family type IX secretion system membrane protein [Bacteroidales bacterium]|nr:PorP/SprF family type IX secretion system membrane protein [Bacteroidales bacterium]
MNKLYLLTVIVTSFLVSLQAHAQLPPSENFYNINPYSINPAATGLYESFSGYLDYRDQWSGLKGAPESIRFGLHGIVSSAMGLGIKGAQTNTGVFKQTSVDLNYSYRIILNKDRESLSFGLLLGFFQYKVNFDNMKLANESDPAIYSSNTVNEAQVRTGFGVHYNLMDLNIHFAVPSLYSTVNGKFLQNINSLATYDFYAGENIWRIQPAILYRYDEVRKSQAEISITGEWENKVWAMAGYRTNKNIVTGIGINIKTIGIGYSYEINRSELSTVASFSHEIILTFNTQMKLSKRGSLYRQPGRRDPWN